jgi:hypothetical protein
MIHDYGRYQAKFNDLWAGTLNISNAWEPLSRREPKRLNRAGSAVFRPTQHRALTDPRQGKAFGAGRLLTRFEEMTPEVNCSVAESVDMSWRIHGPAVASCRRTITVWLTRVFSVRNGSAVASTASVAGTK